LKKKRRNEQEFRTLGCFATSPSKIKTTIIFEDYGWDSEALPVKTREKWI